MATLHHVITNNFDAYVEGKNLTNSIVRSYLIGDRSLVWANGAATGQGFSPLQSSALPPALVAKLASKIAAIEVTVQAALLGRFDLFVEALLADGAVTEPAAAVALARDLIDAHKTHLPQFA